MKYNLVNTILFLTVGLVSCNSVDDVLKPSDSISISILETLDTVRVVPGDTVVITAGVPIGRSGTTNLIKAQKVDDPL